MKSITNNSALEEHIEDLKSEVEEIMHQKLPQNLKLVRLLLKSATLQQPPLQLQKSTGTEENNNCIPNISGEFDLKSMENSLANGVDTKKTEFDDCQTFRFPSNKTVIELVEKIDPLSEEFYGFTKTIYAWMELLKPKLATGNSFGSEVITEVSTSIYKAGITRLNQAEYFQLRSKMCSKVQKYPENEDAINAIISYDWSRISSLLNCLRDLRDGHAEVLDLLTKNWPTIISVEESSSTCDSMY